MQKFKLRYLRIRSRHPSHHVIRRKILVPGLCLLRLGSTTDGSTNRFKVILNTKESIQISSNKLKMKDKFKEHNVISPEYYKEAKEIPREKEAFPILAKKIYGSRGNGMIKIDTSEDLDSFLKGDTKGYYYEKYYAYCREYRLHVSELGCFYTCRKVRKEEATDRWFFNNTNCSWLVEDNPSFNKPKTWDKIVKACIAAKDAVGLDLGACDVRVNKKGEFQIIEINSAPSFGDTTVEKYKEHLPLLIKEKLK